MPKFSIVGNKVIVDDNNKNYIFFLRDVRNVRKEEEYRKFKEMIGDVIFIKLTIEFYGTQEPIVISRGKIIADQVGLLYMALREKLA